MTYYSQSGEDKFLEPFLPEYGFFVDIGAHDGLKFSNTQMVYQKGWSGLAVEGNLKYFRALMANMAAPNVVKIPRYIQEFELDFLLKTYGVNQDFDLLSIDIDSYDYTLWKKMEYFHPKFVIIEVGSWIEPDAMELLGQRKGYKLIWAEANFIFKRK